MLKTLHHIDFMLKMYTKKMHKLWQNRHETEQRELQYAGMKLILRKQILSIRKMYLNKAHLPKSNQTITI